VAKIYHEPTADRSAKLGVMVANPPNDPAASSGHTSIAWAGGPSARAAERPAGRVGLPDAARAGYAASCTSSITRPCGVKAARCLTTCTMHRAAATLLSAVGALHARGYVIGDVNESNILISDSALVTLIDTDSFQVSGPYRWPRITGAWWGKPEFTRGAAGCRHSGSGRSPGLRTMRSARPC